jgi:protein HIRA/HIR1
MCRSSDGLNLYAVSSDGTLGVFTFEPHELGGVASHDEQKQYLRKYNFIPAPLPGGFVHPGQNGDTSSSQPVRPIVAAPQGEVVNTLVAKRKDKSRNGARRVNLIGNVPSAGVPSASTPSQLPRVNGYAAPSLPTPSVPRPSNTVQQATSSSYQRTPSAPNTNTGVTTDGFGYEDSHMDDVHNNPNISGDVASFAHLDTSSPQNPRRTSGDMLGEEGRLKPRTLGGDQQRQNVPVRELTGPSQPQPYPVMASGSGNHPILPALPVLSVISARAGQGSSEALLEGKNTDTGGAFLSATSHC